MLMILLKLIENKWLKWLKQVKVVNSKTIQKIKLLFIIYADFESMLKSENIEKKNSDESQYQCQSKLQNSYHISQSKKL